MRKYSEIKLKKNIFLGILFICLIGFTLPVVGVGVSPSRIEENFSSGQTVKGFFTVSNRIDKKSLVEISLHDWDISKKGESVIREVGQIKRSAVKWITLEDSKVILNPGESKEISYILKVPQKVQGSYFALFTFEEKKLTNNQVGIPMVVRLGVPLYIKIKGTEMIQAEIGEIALRKENGVLFLDVEVENRGNVHFRPDIKVTIFKEEVQVDQFELVRDLPVLPGATRSFTKRLLPELAKSFQSKNRVVVEMSFNNQLLKAEKLLGL